MKTKLALIAVALSSLFSASQVFAREVARPSEATESLFAKIDLDEDRFVDEAELTSALIFREVRRQERVAKVESRNEVMASAMRARMEAKQDDPMLGTPERAATFILANFDRDGDWALDQAELDEAFSSLRKWRSEGRS